MAFLLPAKSYWGEDLFFTPSNVQSLTLASRLLVSNSRFLNSNFWQTYRQHGSPSIEDLLSKDDCTVEKLLDDEDII